MFTRSNVKPRLYRLVGSFGEPLYVMPLARRYKRRWSTPPTDPADPARLTGLTEVVDVVAVRPSPFAPARRLTVPTSQLRPWDIDRTPEGVIASLVRCGTLSVSEGSALLVSKATARLEALADARKVRSGRYTRPPHNIGAGVLTLDHMVLLR